MSIQLLEPAQAELDEAIAWYAEQAPGLGEAFLIETLKAFELIERFPQAWHSLSPQIRRCRLRRFPYSVVYTQDGADLCRFRWVNTTMHSESALVHAQAVALFAQPGLEGNLDFELRHQAIITRFGRYPHRNAVLGRTSTPEELAFLSEPGSSF